MRFFIDRWSKIFDECLDECWLTIFLRLVRREQDGVTEGTSEVKISKEGVCSVKCFDEGSGTCVLSLVCSTSPSRSLSNFCTTKSISITFLSTAH